MTRRNNVWSVDLAGGGVRQGRDTYYDVFPVSITLITSAMGRQAFLSFLEKVDGGASSFWMAHDFGMGIEDYQVTITSTIAESTEDGINWTITFTATAEKSPFQDLENQCLINNLPDLYGCYGDCLGSFLKIYANYETTFPRIWSNEGPAGYPPINLLVSTLDSRVVYDGPQVYYINRNGNLVQSAANEWPLTFIDGVAVGRVPPEDSATNLVAYSSEFSNSAWSRARVAIEIGSAAAPFTQSLADKLVATSVTRPKASAKVAMNGATSIDITYSDGSTVNVPAVDNYATIPQADSAWGSKYITRIDFNVDG